MQGRLLHHTQGRRTTWAPIMSGDEGHRPSPTSTSASVSQPLTLQSIRSQYNAGTACATNKVDACVDHASDLKFTKCICFPRSIPGLPRGCS